MRRLVIACLLALAIALTSGCSSRQSGGFAPDRSPEASAEPTASLQANHGDNFVRSSIDSTAPAAAGVVMHVTLKEALGPGELAGKRPYADIALLRSLHPSRQWYRVIYRVGDDESMWAWGTSSLHQLQYWSRLRLLHPSSYVDGVTEAKLQAVADGDAAPLKLQNAR